MILPLSCRKNSQMRWDGKSHLPKGEGNSKLSLVHDLQKVVHKFQSLSDGHSRGKMYLDLFSLSDLDWAKCSISFPSAVTISDRKLHSEILSLWQLPSTCPCHLSIPWLTPLSLCLVSLGWESHHILNEAQIQKLEGPFKASLPS